MVYIFWNNKYIQEEQKVIYSLSLGITSCHPQTPSSVKIKSKIIKVKDTKNNEDQKNKEQRAEQRGERRRRENSCLPIHTYRSKEIQIIFVYVLSSNLFEILLKVAHNIVEMIPFPWHRKCMRPSHVRP